MSFQGPPPPGGAVWQSVEEFQTALERQGQNVENLLVQAHGDERTRMANELHEVKRQLYDVTVAYADRQNKVRELEIELIRLNGQDGERLVEIRAAMESGDFSRADALLAKIEGHGNTTVVRVSEAAFQRGRIAALQIKWGVAATHFDRAARLDPTYDHLMEAGKYAERAARYKLAFQHFEKLLDVCRSEHGLKSLKTALQC